MENIASKQQILTYISVHQKARVDDLWRHLGFSRQLVQKKLKELVTEKLVIKSGKPPLVFYQLAVQESLAPVESIPKNLVDFIDKEYLYVSPLGELIYGFEGFSRWVSSIREQNNIRRLAQEYKKTVNTVKEKFNKFGFIDATEKVKQTFPNTYIDKVYYLDFYALPKFGKTKLGQLLLYSKQAQNYELIRTLSLQVKPKIQQLLAREKITAVSFIPPTVPRNIQFIKEFEKILDISLPHIDLSKAYLGDVPIAQKTLSRLEERVQNASRTIFVRNSAKYERVLLIDDAVGSGASLNETAKKLVAGGLAKSVIGVAVVGSYKGFDVIREI
ncbi:MAG: hypothetical protein ABIG91_02895 [Patescibacteria group bacterium]